MAIVTVIRVVELHKHKVYQMAIKWRLSNCHVFLASSSGLLDIAKVNFSVIILNSGFRIPAFRVAEAEQVFLPTGLLVHNLVVR